MEEGFTAALSSTNANCVMRIGRTLTKWGEPPLNVLIEFETEITRL
jgi:hypothetical protein